MSTSDTLIPRNSFEAAKHQMAPKVWLPQKCPPSRTSEMFWNCVGGEDPNPGPAEREERFWGGLVVLMVAIIVLGGFLLTILGIVLSSGGPR